MPHSTWRGGASKTWGETAAYIAKTEAAAAQQQAKANARDRSQKHQQFQMCRLYGECRANDRHYVWRPVSQQTWDAWNNGQQDAYAAVVVGGE